MAVPKKPTKSTKPKWPRPLTEAMTWPEKRIWHKKLRVAREALGKAQHEIAFAVGTSQTKVSVMENGPDPGQHPLKIEPLMLCKLADALQVPVRYLCDETIPVQDQPPLASDGLSEAEHKLLDVARMLGLKVALARLVHAKTPTPAPAPDQPEPAPPPPPARPITPNAAAPVHDLTPRRGPGRPRKRVAPILTPTTSPPRSAQRGGVGRGTRVEPPPPPKSAPPASRPDRIRRALARKRPKART